jgi:hypothetical protein
VFVDRAIAADEHDEPSKEDDTTDPLTTSTGISAWDVILLSDRDGSTKAAPQWTASSPILAETGVNQRKRAMRTRLFAARIVGHREDTPGIVRGSCA